MKTIATSFKPDIIVAGGGTAGSAAAVAAARRGHKILLIEEGNCLGGVSTAGGVNEFYANLEGLGSIFTRLITELENFGALHGRYFTGEYLKLIWQILADEAGVDILFNTSVVDAETEAGRLTGVRTV
jgi:glycine/D-amino acid oxidase-like deaminating enzyme